MTEEKIGVTVQFPKRDAELLSEIAKAAGMPRAQLLRWKVQELIGPHAGDLNGEQKRTGR